MIRVAIQREPVTTRMPNGSPQSPLPLGDRHFRLVIGEYLEHYHRERNHQGLDKELIAGGAAAMRTIGPVRRRARLGGLVNYYVRLLERDFS